MPADYEIIEFVSFDEWDAFVRRAIGGSVFSTWTWLDCAQKAVGGRVRCFGCYRKGRLLAGISGLERQGFGPKTFSTPPMTPHGGLLLEPVRAKGPTKAESAWNHATRILIDHLKALYWNLHIVQSPAIRDVREFTWTGWEARVRYTYQIDLSDLDAAWGRMESRTRTAIRKAAKRGFRLRCTEDLSLLRRQYELVYAHQKGGPPLSASTVQRFAENACRVGLARMFLAECDTGDVAATVVFVRDTEGPVETVYAWVAGADPALSATGAASLLYWRFLEQNRGRRFDFVGANIPSIALFKRGFGGDLVPYFAVRGYRNSWARTVLAGRRKLGALLRF